MQKTEDAGKLLKNLRQQYWSGQAYDLMLDELSSILLIKWYSEKYDQPFNAATFNKLLEDARKFFNIELKIGPQDCRLDNVIHILSGISIRGNNEISQQMHQAWLKKTHRKELGQYFTPPFIRQFMMEIYKPSPTDIICDPAAGSGGFLVEAACAMDFFKPSNFYYFDIDRLGAIPSAEKAFQMFEHPKTGESLDGVNIRQWDSLAQKWDKPPDRIYTNVPFGLVTTDKIVLQKYEVGIDRKSQTSQLLFIEKCLKELNVGGTLATVVDRGIATNLSLRKDRKAIAKMAHLELVVELPGQAFEYFAGTTFGTYLLFFKKYSSTDDFQDKPTKFAKIDNLAYDTKGYLHSLDVEYVKSFDPSGMKLSWDKSDFKKVIDNFHNHSLEKVDYQDILEIGDWLHGSYKFRKVEGDKLKDLASLSSIRWDGENRLNPTVDRKYRMVIETHLNPSKKVNSLVYGSLLFSRLLSETQAPACGIVDDRFKGAGITSENYVIVPKDEDALAKIWHAINFDQSTGEYLRSVSRGQGRGRVKEEDMLNMPVPKVRSIDKILGVIEQIETKLTVDNKLLEKLNSLKP